MSLVEFLSQPLWHRLSLTLVHFLWQGLAVAVIVCAAVRLLRLKRGNPRYATYLLAFAVMAVAPLLTFMALRAPTAVSLTPGPAAEIESAAPVARSMPAPAPQLLNDEALPVGSTYQVPLHQRLYGMLQASLPWALVGWMGGVLILSVRLLLGFVGVRRWQRSAEPLSDDLQTRVTRLSERLGLPGFARVFVSHRARDVLALGYLRPMVLLPASLVTQMPADMLEAVIAHELAHIRRLDLWVNLAQHVVETLLFYHPAVWWLSSRLRSERELCCDELAVQATGERLTYASALETAGRARLALRQATLAVGLGQDRKSILGRVRHVLGLPPSPPDSRFWVAGVVAVALLAVLATPTISVLTAQAESQAASEAEKVPAAPPRQPAQEASPKKNNAAPSSVLPPEDRFLEGLQKGFAQGVVDVNWRDMWGHTILHRACMEGYARVAELLIAKGADVNAGNTTGITPLHTAAGRGHADVVKLLLDKNANINARDNHGATPLWYAKNGVVYSFELFGRFSKRVTAQWKPENPGCKRAVELLVQRGAEEHAPVISLHEAAQAGLIEKVKSLVAEGANVNAMDDRLAATPLHLAAYSNQMEVVEFLIAHGADVNARTRWDQTPLQVALDQRRTGIADLLRQHGATLEPPAQIARAQVSTSLFKSATSKSTIPAKSLEIPEPMQACTANLQKIHAAIKKYEEDKGQLPTWLSDLVPNYVTKEVLLCPNNPETRVRWQTDPKLPCDYVYEFGLTRASERFGGGLIEGMTSRDRKMAQVAYFGDVVPVCRCPQHGQRCLNISVGGEVYLSGPPWESTIMPDYKVGSELSVKLMR